MKLNKITSENNLSSAKIPYFEFLITVIANISKFRECTYTLLQFIVSKGLSILHPLGYTFCLRLISPCLTQIMLNVHGYCVRKNKVYSLYSLADLFILIVMTLLNLVQDHPLAIRLFFTDILIVYIMYLIIL